MSKQQEPQQMAEMVIGVPIYHPNQFLVVGQLLESKSTGDKGLNVLVNLITNTTLDGTSQVLVMQAQISVDRSRALDMAKSLIECAMFDKSKLTAKLTKVMEDIDVLEEVDQVNVRRAAVSILHPQAGRDR